MANLHVPQRDRHEEFAAPRLLLQGFHGALTQDRKFQLAHRAFHAEQQAVVRMAGFVDAVFVNDDRADKAAELDQRMPVAAVARQTGGLDRKDRPGAALADRRQKALETRPGDAGARAPEIIVDDHDILPAQLPRAFRKPILTPPAFVIVQHLVSGRLTNVDEGAARQVIRRDLGHHRSPCTLPPSRSRSEASRPNEASPSVLIPGEAAHHNEMIAPTVTE